MTMVVNMPFLLKYKSRAKDLKPKTPRNGTVQIAVNPESPVKFLCCLYVTIACLGVIIFRTFVPNSGIGTNAMLTAMVMLP